MVPHQSVATLRHSRSFRRIVIGILTLAVLLLGSAVMLFPLVWQFSASLKDAMAIYEFPPSLVPEVPRWQNYADVFTYLPVGTFLINTTILSLLAVVGTVLSCSLVAYAFAALTAPGKNVLFAITLAAMMLPGQVTMIPLFIVFVNIGWFDTWYPLLVPQFLGVPLYIFLLRQLFLGLPPELSDAVEIDGGGHWTIFTRIVLPLSKPGLATVAIFTFIANWNDFFNPLLYLISEDKRTLAVGLQYLQYRHAAGFMEFMGQLMAGSILMLIPIIVMFIAAQKIFVTGANLSGITGR